LVDKKSWNEFRSTGLMWFINQTLHLFGWALVYDSVNETVYPARCKFRGFSEDINTKGYIKVSKYINENSETLLKESME
jgi:hypothetical protein